MMKILVWNSRGAASKGFVALLRYLRFRYKVDLVVILQPRISGSLATRVIKNWGFKNLGRVEAEEFSRGIWLLWGMDELFVDVLVKNDQFIHLTLNVENKRFCARNFRYEAIWQMHETFEKVMKELR
ncbi:hypothetical protein K1719_002731 [Acacia pycnantha]|nr:hypothetical protein K1719_002731 [Acacia pycnantha]